MTGLSPWALETVSQFDVRLCREGIPCRGNPLWLPTSGQAQGPAPTSVIPRHDVPRNPSTSFGVPYSRDPLKRDVASTMNDPVNVIMTQSGQPGISLEGMPYYVRHDTHRVTPRALPEGPPHGRPRIRSA